MGLIVRSEPVSTKYLEGYPKIKEMLQQVGWLQFLENFNGFHKEVTKSFPWSLNGSKVEIPRQGERWFKNKEFHNEAWRQMLKTPGMDISVFKKGIPSSALKNKW